MGSVWFRSIKSGIKLHALLDLRANIPSFISITDAKFHDVNILEELIAEPGTINVLVAIMKKKLKLEQSHYR
jgi:hypothetical protein